MYDYCCFYSISTLTNHQIYVILSSPLQEEGKQAMREEEKVSRQKMLETEEVYQMLKKRILLYSNLYVPDFIIYDLAKSMEEFYEESSD